MSKSKSYIDLDEAKIQDFFKRVSELNGELTGSQAERIWLIRDAALRGLSSTPSVRNKS